MTGINDLKIHSDPSGSFSAIEIREYGIENTGIAIFDRSWFLNGRPNAKRNNYTGHDDCHKFWLSQSKIDLYVYSPFVREISQKIVELWLLGQCTKVDLNE